MSAADTIRSAVAGLQAACTTLLGLATALEVSADPVLPPTVPPAPIPPPPPVAVPVDGQVLVFDFTGIPAGSNRRRTSSGFFGDGMVIAKFTVGADWRGQGAIAFGPFGGADILRTVKLSAVAGDITGGLVGTNGSIPYLVAFAAPGYPTLAQGQTYYLNVVNCDQDGNLTCPAGVTADIFIEVKRC